MALGRRKPKQGDLFIPTAQLAQAEGIQNPTDEDRRRLDELHLEYPAFGSRRPVVMLQRRGYPVNRKQVARLLRVMGLEAIYPRRQLSQPGEGHEIQPYLLRGLEINLSLQLYHSILSPKDLAPKYGLIDCPVPVPKDTSVCLPPGEMPRTHDPEDPAHKR